MGSGSRGDLEVMDGLIQGVSRGIVEILRTRSNREFDLNDKFVDRRGMAWLDLDCKGTVLSTGTRRA